MKLCGRGTYVTEGAQLKLNEGKVLQVKEQLRQLIIEAHHAGIDIHQLKEWLEEIGSSLKGGKQVD